MSQSISRRSFLKCAGSGAVSLAAALLTGVPAAAQQPRLAGEPALLDGKAAVELLGYAPAQEMGNVLVYLSVENLSASTLPVGASYLQSREVCTLGDLYSMGTGVTAVCDGKPVRCGSFAAPLYGENAADASVFTLNLTAGRGALLHCFCAVPEDWQGRSIGEVDIRRKYGVNILGVKRNGKTDVNISPEIILDGSLTLLVLGENKALKKQFRL